MRVALLAILILAALAGCTQAPKDKDPLVGYCPDWLASSQTDTGAISLDAPGSANETFVPTNLTQFGLPFDMVRLKVTAASGSLTLRAYDEHGRQLTLRDPRVNGLVPAITIGSDAKDVELEAHLSSMSNQDVPVPGPIRLQWTVSEGAGSVSHGVTFHYRVCGGVA